MAWPKYAAKYKDQKHLLVQFRCKNGCRDKQRYGLPSVQGWTKETPAVYVTCLMCHERQSDPYNWMRLA